ncbi:LOW QUALITY PROTEIN: uncharacterized protein LOC111068687 [Drosophila obscura]|uniref:LOW QUALITY PROTEIN: uncharacterized protein LOC111068687 n=1 Tax=Drosophila obscura TaxID=7282 RepID=UPI001BB1EAC6|nr:LOW QUALITY PROTEIN: uncharacterized protein LOC111068687 [Drosophila obscura]
MGCSCSRPLEYDGATPNPLQAAIAPPRVQRRRQQEEKRMRQLQKLQKRNARKRQQKRVSSGGGSSGSIQRRRVSGGKQCQDLALQLRLLGGSNGSSATECVSALYARTLEHQREELQRTIEQKTLQQLDKELHTFLLNQLLLGLQFFAHFDAEMGAMDVELQFQRRACGQSLTEHSLLQASAIDVAVAKHLLFKPIAAKHSQPLQKPLTYVVFENVDISRPNDANYDSIATLCKVLLESDYYTSTPCRSEYVQLMEQSRWMGYVRLKLREEQGAHEQAQPASSSPRPIGRAASSGDEGEGDGIYTDGGGSTSGYSSGSWREGDYDHVYLARLNTLRPMEELRMGSGPPLERNVLPEGCICRLASCLPAWLEQSDDDDDDEDESCPNSDGEEEEEADEQEAPRSAYETVQVLRQCRVEQQRRQALLQQSYLSSEQFMKYFADLLRQQLARELQIPASLLANGSYRGCSVYTDREELVPAIHVPNAWPDCAFEFNLRARPRLTNLHTDEKFQWPTEQMRNRIRSFGFHVVPVGYAPKHSRNPFRELEWRIVFPQAEQFLERQLTAMQLKVFLLMKVLVRTFVSDKCQAMGSLVEQLRAHLFWQCERHSNDWPEEFLGERLLRFVRSFDECLARKHLSDYFIERRNLFEHVPEDALMELRSIMAGIAEQPLLHLVQALRNLDHAPDFYPKLDYKRLLENFCCQDYLQLHSWGRFSRSANSILQQAHLQQQQLDEEQQEQSQRVEVTDARGLLGMPQHQERSRGKLRRKTQMLRASNQQLQELADQRRSSLDSSSMMDMSMQLLLSRSRSLQDTPPSQCPAGPQLNNGLEILRRTNLLELLIDHLLAMLAKATQFGNRLHAELYLEQAQRLCRLYQKLGCSQNAQHYVEELLQASADIEGMCVAGAETPPALPRRSFSGSIRSSPSPSPMPSPHPSPLTPRQRRKSIKFMEHVVQIHTPDPMSRQVLPLPHHTAPGILKGNTQPKPEGAVPGIREEPAQTVVSPTESILSLNTLLQRLHVDPDRLQTLSSKTEQVIQTLAPSEAKREELRDILKRNTQKFKEAFN